MEQIYILIKHENKIETDNVEVLSVSKNKEEITKEFNNIHAKLSKKYDLLEEVEGFASFTNKNKEFLIELSIEMRILE